MKIVTIKSGKILDLIAENDKDMKLFDKIENKFHVSIEVENGDKLRLEAENTDDEKLLKRIEMYVLSHNN